MSKPNELNSSEPDPTENPAAGCGSSSGTSQVTSAHRAHKHFEGRERHNLAMLTASIHHWPRPLPPPRCRQLSN